MPFTLPHELRDERGAVLVLTALTIPVVVGFGAFALGITTVWTSRNDLQRAADLAALNAAAATPTASADLPLEGTEPICPPGLDDPDPNEWRERPFFVVADQLVDGRSAVSTAFADGEPSVCARWTYESQVLAVLGACAADVAELAGCRDALDDELRANLPLVTDLDASARSAVDALHAALDPADKLVDEVLAGDLGDGCAHEVGTTVLGLTTFECTHRVAELLDAIDHDTGSLLGTVDALLLSLVEPLQEAAADGLLDPTVARGTGFAPGAVPRLGLDVAGAAPAVVTPRVRVALDDLALRPALSPFTFDMAASATARRQIKSALALPTIGIPGVESWAALGAETQARLTDKLGASAAVALEAAFDAGGWVVDPQVLASAATRTADLVLDEIDAAEVAVSVAVTDSLCGALPADVACPVGDDVVDRQHLLGPFTGDVRDATQPPPSQAPTVQDVLEAYADSDQVVWIISGLRMLMPEHLLGETVWQTLRNARGVYDELSDPPADVGDLLSPLMFVPALDVVPATVTRDGGLYRVERATAERVAATPGLYRSRLVR